MKNMQEAHDLYARVSLWEGCRVWFGFGVVNHNDPSTLEGSRWAHTRGISSRTIFRD